MVRIIAVFPIGIKCTMMSMEQIQDMPHFMGNDMGCTKMRSVIAPNQIEFRTISYSVSQPMGGKNNHFEIDICLSRHYGY